MQRLSEILSKKLPLLIILMAVGTYLSPIHLVVAPWFPSLLLGMVIFFTGISMNIEAIKEIRTKKRELVLATFLKWTLTVGISIGLAHLLFSTRPEIAGGLILAGTVPSATAATIYTFLAGGNTSLVIAASLLDVTISPIVTPMALHGLSDEVVKISFLNLLQSFGLIVILPLGLGLGVQRMTPQVVHYSKSITRLGSSIALLLIVQTLVGSGKMAISSELSILPLLALATFIQVIVPMGAAYFIALKLKISESDARAILFHVGLCNTALAAILAFKFIGELGVIAPILNMIFNLSIGAYISNYLSKKNIPSPHETYSKASP